MTVKHTHHLLLVLESVTGFGGDFGVSVHAHQDQ